MLLMRPDAFGGRARQYPPKARQYPPKVTADDLLSAAMDNSPEYYPSIVGISDEKAS